MPIIPIHSTPIEPDPECVFRDGALTLWHTQGSNAEPVLVLDLGGPDLIAAHSLAARRVTALIRALMSTQPVVSLSVVVPLRKEV